MLADRPGAQMLSASRLVCTVGRQAGRQAGKQEL